MSRDPSTLSKSQARFALARAWHSKGVLPAAIAGYRETLALDPTHAEAAVLLGALMESQMRLEEALEIYRRALEYNPSDSRLHKHFVKVMVALDGFEAVFDHYGLARKDVRPLNLRPEEILCCLVLRNESPRLPYFLEYYRKQGISTFFAVDNASSDGSPDYLLQQPDVYLWQSRRSFNLSNFGAGWFEPLLSRYGRGHWCLIVDADELFYYPDCEHRTIDDLCRSLDQEKKRAFPAIHLDMYSDKPVRDTHYTPGQPFEETCPYFDREFFHTVEHTAGPYSNQSVYIGGVRQRIFGASAYYLSKVPLIKYEQDCILAGGQHWTNLPATEISEQRGCLLHFKYFSSFPGLVLQETRRKEHSAEAMLYREYEQGFQEQPALTFYDSAHSIRFSGTDQLIQLGVMRAGVRTNRGATDQTPNGWEFPRIEVVAPGPRPFWSVMLTVNRRVTYLEQALRSVLGQAPDAGQMQIEVVSDGPEHPLLADLENLVRSVAGERVTFYPCPDRAGQPGIFNECIRRARGQWIHILHDDDWVAPGFYQTIHDGITQAVDIGAAFCRQTYVDEDGRKTRFSFLERETPGLIDDWLNRIACSCRLQTPSIVVRREVYERQGGYCPQAKSAFDWEMWQRLAVHYPVWYEPKPLAFFRVSSGSESARLMYSAQQIADARSVVEIARSYLPEANKDTLSRRAYEHYASRALELVRTHVDRGNLPVAMSHLEEAVRCSRSEEFIVELLACLRRLSESIPSEHEMG